MNKSIFSIALIAILAVIAASLSSIEAVRSSSRYTHPRALLFTTYGIITFALYPQNSPKTVENFIQLSKSGFYNHSYFYRNAQFPNGTGFVVQGGGYNVTSNKTVPMEYSLPNKKWSVGLARGNSPDSGSSEYFINVNDNSHLLAPGGVTPDGYCAFAEVVEGFAVVQAMMKLPSHESTADGMREFDKFPIVFSIKIIY